MGISHPLHNRVCLLRPWVQFQNPHQTLVQAGTVHGPLEEKELQEEPPSTGHLVKPRQSRECAERCGVWLCGGGDGERKLSDFLLSFQSRGLCHVCLSKARLICFLAALRTEAEAQHTQCEPGGDRPPEAGAPSLWAWQTPCCHC